MANDQISLDEYLKQLNTRVEVEVEDYKVPDWKWEANPIEQLTINGIDPLTTYSSGTSYRAQQAMPIVTIGHGSNVNPTVWTTTTNNTGGYTFANQNIQPNNTIQIKGENADLLINDKSLKTWMEKVEERLNILTPNPEMEAEWDQLRKLGERYRKLEKKCKEKSDMWNKLKAMPKPEIK
jgi:hypothetical protein